MGRQGDHVVAPLLELAEQTLDRARLGQQSGADAYAAKAEAIRDAIEPLLGLGLALLEALPGRVEDMDQRDVSVAQVRQPNHWLQDGLGIDGQVQLDQNRAQTTWRRGAARFLRTDQEDGSVPMAHQVFGLPIDPEAFDSLMTVTSRHDE